MRRIATLLLTALLLSACGQKGNLYLPDQQRNVVLTPGPTASAAPAAPADPTVPQSSPEDPQKKSDASKRN